jgi:hypothetical protein
MFVLIMNCYSFETESYYVASVVLKLLEIHLSLPSEC